MELGEPPGLEGPAAVGNWNCTYYARWGYSADDRSRGFDYVDRHSLGFGGLGFGGRRSRESSLRGALDGRNNRGGYHGRGAERYHGRGAERFCDGDCWVGLDDCVDHCRIGTDLGSSHLGAVLDGAAQQSESQ